MKLRHLLRIPGMLLQRPRARRSVQAARTMSLQMYDDLSERWPQMSDVDQDAWEFFATVGIIECGIQTLPLTQLSPRAAVSYGSALNMELAQWNPDADTAILDLRRSLARAAGQTPERRLEMQSALVVFGVWVVRNALGGAELDDPELAAVAGQLIGSHADLHVVP